MKKRTIWVWMLVMVLGGGAFGQGLGDRERITELERKVEILSRELGARQVGGIVGPVEGGEHGMAPSASKVYQADGGLSIGGYGEMLYQGHPDGDGEDELDFLRAVLYFGFKYDERFVFNSEFEVEHASTDQGGSVSAEFAYLDYLWRPELNLRAGLLLIPVGIINEWHEPTVYLSAARPAVERVIIPSTWRENGFGAFGDLGDFRYKLYLVNGMQAEGFRPGGLRGGRQKGSEALAEDVALVGRLDWVPAPGLTLGGSVYIGDSGQDLEAAARTTMAEGHLDWNWRGWEVTALAVAAELDDVAALNRLLARRDDGTTPPDAEIDSIGERMTGGYLQVGYDVLSVLGRGETALTPYVRYERYDTQDDVPAGFARSGDFDVELLTVGLNLQPIDEIVLKAEYQFIDNESGSAGDLVNIAMGYVF